MSYIGTKFSEETVAEEEGLPKCGTVACIAGWTGILILGDKLKWDTDGDPKRNLWNFAQKTLGLRKTAYTRGKRAYAAQMFNVFDWPQPFKDRFNDTYRTNFPIGKGREQRAKITVERLEHYLTTGL